MYKLLPSTPMGESKCVLNTQTKEVIPFNLDNRDYREYLKWVAEGNTPEPADE